MLSKILPHIAGEQTHLSFGGESGSFCFFCLIKNDVLTAKVKQLQKRQVYTSTFVFFENISSLNMFPNFGVKRRIDFEKHSSWRINSLHPKNPT